MYTAHFIVSYTSDDVLSIYACTASLAFGPQIWSASTANLRPQPNKPKAVPRDTPQQSWKLYGGALLPIFLWSVPQLLVYITVKVL